MSGELTSMELDVLDMLVNGRSTWSDTGHAIIWGGAISEIVESLSAKRLVAYPQVSVTEAGREALARSRGAAVSSGHVQIAHDGFAGDIIGHYVTREGKRGVVVQQDGTRVVHVYGEKWLQPGAAQES